MKEKRIQNNIISKEILARELDNINEVVDPQFQFFDSDYRELANHSVIYKKTMDWGNSITPNYLFGLKIKQRQNEYWKKRIKRDFSPTLQIKKKRQQMDLKGFISDNNCDDEKHNNSSNILILKKM